MAGVPEVQVNKNYFNRTALSCYLTLKIFSPVLRIRIRIQGAKYQPKTEEKKKISLKSKI